MTFYFSLVKLNPLIRKEEVEDEKAEKDGGGDGKRQTTTKKFSERRPRQI